MLKRFFADVRNPDAHGAGAASQPQLGTFSKAEIVRLPAFFADARRTARAVKADLTLRVELASALGNVKAGGLACPAVDTCSLTCCFPRMIVIGQFDQSTPPSTV
jgi:hypothetical protein